MRAWLIRVLSWFSSSLRVSRRSHQPQPAARRRIAGQPAYGKARGATIRRDLIDVAARTARHGRGHITLHLPEAWHREQQWMTLFEAACGPPAAAA